MALQTVTAPHQPYWRRLVVWGVGLEALSGVFTIVAANQTVDDLGQSSDSGGYVLLAVLLGSVGALLLIPGLIGWGIDSAGLAVRLAPPAPAVPLAPPAPPPASGPLFTRFCSSCGAGVGNTDTHCWKCHKPL